MEQRSIDEARLGPDGFPDWQELYASQPVETMPWYHPALDHDLEAALEARNLSTGTFLDIGTGPGTQAVLLAKRGFTVTATDLADTAITKASALSAEVRWMQDDILKTRLSEPFDFVFDRGCFHVLDPKDRPTYVATLKRLVVPGGVTFLKCFSVDQPGERGPHRFSHHDIHAIFGVDFEIESVHDSEYRGQLTPPPKALFVVLRAPG
jgi:SAM-dependent methyltransferase